MTLELPRLPQLEPSHADLQIWWQKVVESIEQHEIRQDEVDVQLTAAVELLNTTVELLNTTVESLGDALERLGLVEELADGTFGIVDQGLNPDGTVKPNKVLTDSPIAAAFAEPVSEVSLSGVVPDTGVETVLHTSTVRTVGDATYGSCVVTFQGNWDNSADTDAGAEMYPETNSNGAGWVRHTQYTISCGCRTNGGNTTALMPFYRTIALNGVGLQTVQARLVGKSVDIGAGIKNSTVVTPSTMVAPGRR